MNKRFLLLRNNIETGTYTIDELLLQNLQPSDLIWVEGESNSWETPSQIIYLKTRQTQLNASDQDSCLVQPASFIAPAPVEKNRIHFEPSSFNNITQSKPSPIPAVDDLEKRAEEIKAKALSHAAPNLYQKPILEERTYPKTTALLEEDSIELVVHNRRKYFTLPQLIAAGLITFVVAAGINGAWSPINPQQEKSTVVTAAPILLSEEPKPQQTTYTEVVAAIEEMQADTLSKIAELPQKPKKKKRDTVKLTSPEPASTIAVTDAPLVADQINEVPPVDTGKSVAIETKEEPIVEPEAKKKTLGQAIKGLFRKRNKEKTTTEGALPDTSKEDNSRS